uniref:Transposase (Putative), gypsy type n=1 Tax=Tanacetum cinerariifolium TaxID=118510 RepID=A0A699I752_TANCI|nr:hypothetical protein [Tanacetum cinerariifolium]
MDLFKLISAPNPSKVKTGLRPRAAHEVPLLTDTASQVIDMEDPDVATKSSGTPFAIEKSPLDFDNENPSPSMTEGKGTEDQAHETVAPEISPSPGNMPATRATSELSLKEEVAAMEPRLSKKTSFEFSTRNVATIEVQDMHFAESARSGKSTSSSSMVGSPEGIYQPGWDVTNNCRLDTPDACQDVVDHIVSPGYFSELRHMPNPEFLSQYNKNLQVAMGSQLRLRFEQEEVQGLQNQTSNLKTLLEAVADMKKAAEAKNADLTKELESLRTQFLDLQVSNDQLNQQVSTLQTQVIGEERIRAAFEEFKKYEDDRVDKRCAKMDARLDALSIDFDEELYPHMLTAIAGRRWVIWHSLRLAVMKCAESIELRQAFANIVSARIAKGMSEGLAHGIEHGKAVRGLKDVPMEVIMASLHLESDAGEDAPKLIRDLRPSTSQLKILVYPEVGDPRDPWAVKEEMLLEEAIAANVSRAEKKKRCRWFVVPMGSVPPIMPDLTTSLYRCLPMLLKVLRSY